MNRIQGTTGVVRYAAVTVPKTTETEEIARYLPGNYEVVGRVQDAIELSTGYHDEVIIAGSDRAGWTMDEYVLPRLQSGLHFARELRGVA